MTQRVYLALVHHPTLDRDGNVVTTAVTTLDLHDLCRLARTFGLGGVYAATPLSAQRDLVRSLLDHWIEGRGGRANPSRREALRGLTVVGSLGEAAADVQARWDLPPILLGTSAREEPGRVRFADARARLASAGRPAVLVFGTGWGLAPTVLCCCEWLLEPISGPGTYNHLSVRSAASIIVDRLLGDWQGRNSTEY